MLTTIYSFTNHLFFYFSSARTSDFFLFLLTDHSVQRVTKIVLIYVVTKKYIYSTLDPLDDIISPHPGPKLSRPGHRVYEGRKKNLTNL